MDFSLLGVGMDKPREPARRVGRDRHGHISQTFRLRAQRLPVRDKMPDLPLSITRLVVKIKLIPFLLP